MELIRLADHNKKLKNTYSVNEKGVKTVVTQFLIFSLPAEKTCPQSTEMCRKSCYAKKAERLYKNTRIARDRNYKQSLKNDFVAVMIATIEYHMNKPNCKNANFLFRIHESGDFYSAEYMRKWVAIANHFKGNKRITFCAYTKSLEIFKTCKNEIPKNLIIRASIWNDTTSESMKFINKHHMPFFKTVNKADMENAVKNDKLFKCVGNCGKCKVCYSKYQKVAVLLH
jgi:hypothetical protein